MLTDSSITAAVLPMRLLCLDPQEPSWTTLAIALESQMGRPSRLRWCDNAGLALSLLRSEQFDCILVGCFERDRAFWLRNSPAKVIQSIRGVGCSDPILVLLDGGWELELASLAPLDCEVISSAGWDASLLAPWMARAIRRHDLQRDHQRLSNRDIRRSSWEREESMVQLQQQREIADRFLREEHADGSRSAEHRPQLIAVPEPVRQYYLELLRTYVIMGTGDLAEDLGHLARGLSEAGVSMPEAFDLHLDCLTRLVDGLGTQSMRHILSRATLLSVEFLLHMNEQLTHRQDQPAMGSYGIDLYDDSMED